MEAFAAILRHDFSVAQRALARAQTEHYGLKPWRPGVPTKNALGQAIVFRDHQLGRFSVPVVRHDGAHIRVPIPDAHPYQLGKFEAWARTCEAACEIGIDYALLFERAPRHIGSRKEDGYVVVRFDIGRALD